MYALKFTGQLTGLFPFSYFIIVFGNENTPY